MPHSRIESSYQIWHLWVFFTKRKTSCEHCCGQTFTVSSSFLWFSVLIILWRHQQTSIFDYCRFLLCIKHIRWNLLTLQWISEHFISISDCPQFGNRVENIIRLWQFSITFLGFFYRNLFQVNARYIHIHW